MVYVVFGDQVLRSSNGLILPDIKEQDAKNKFEIDLEIPLGDPRYYTVVIHDLTFPYVHMLAYNVQQNNLLNSDYLFEYEPPNPPLNSSPHIYSVEVYRQPYKIARINNVYQRMGYPVDKSVQGFPLVDAMAFTVGDVISPIVNDSEINLASSMGLSVPSPQQGIQIPRISRVDSTSMVPSPQQSIQIPDISRVSPQQGIQMPKISPVLSSPSVSSGIQIPVIPSSPIITQPQRFLKRGQHDFFIENTNLTDLQQKFCSCILKVEARGTARNSYAVCAHSVGTTTRECTANYDFDKMPDYLIQSYASLHKKELPEPYNRQQAISFLKNK